MENAGFGELSEVSSMIDELGLSIWKLKSCFVKYISCLVLWPLFIFISPGHTELWAVFKGCWWHWTLQSTRLIPLLPALSKAPALASAAIWREAQAETVTQNLTLVLLPCHSAVGDYPMRLMISWVGSIFCFKVGGLLGLLLGPPLGMVFWISDFPAEEKLGVGRGNLWWMLRLRLGLCFRQLSW